jgi:hypothetical protein
VSSEESIILTEIRDRYNRIILESKGTEIPDVTEIENSIFEDEDITPQPVTLDIKKRVPGMLGARRRALRKVSMDIADLWGPPIEALDRCLALADVVYTRLSRAIFTNGDVLRGKDPRPAPDRVTGAYVKCLLMLSLYGKSCAIANEIASLIRTGLSDAALSRLRTLHEHLVVLTVLHNDDDYEMSEQYEDCSVFERLKFLKANVSELSDPIWAPPSQEEEQKLLAELAETEALAQGIVARRGPRIRKPYEWARQMLPQEKRENLKYGIKYVDLEKAVGMDFFRSSYLTGNEHVHAGSYSAVNHLDFDKPLIPRTRPRRDSWAIRQAGWRTAFLISNIARAAGKAIAWETEEYDELLYVCELWRTSDKVLDSFMNADASVLPSS